MRVKEEVVSVPNSPAKNAGNARYNEKCDTIQLRPLREQGEAIRAAAQAAGQSLQAYILQACRERMEREADE